MPESAWNPQSEPGWLSIRMSAAPDARGARSVLLRHPTRPFVRDCGRVESMDALHPIAFEYIESVWPLLHIPTRTWLEDLRPGAVEPRVDEIVCTWLPDATHEARGSKWVERRIDGRVLDRTAVLIAGLALRSQGGHVWPLYGGQGLSMAVEVDDGAGKARITGLACTLPPIDKAQSRGRLAEVVDTMEAELFRAFGLEGEVYLQDYGLHLVDEEHVDVVALVATEPEAAVRRSAGWFPAPEMLVARWDGSAGGAGRIVPLSRSRRVAHGARVLERDPVAGAGPKSFWALRPYKAAAVEAKAVEVGHGGQGGRPLENEYVKVVESAWTVRGTGRAPGDAATRGDSVSVRGKVSAALHAEHNVATLFTRMLEWGLEPKAHLPFMQFPLQVEYLAGITPGPGRDGRTVNAQVQWGEPRNRGSFRRIFGGMPEAENMQPAPLIVRFALAHVHGGDLGIATDPRWCWHELSHVLLAGATGELEFRFAHSAGDALAAIQCDPESQLAREPGWRGLTFPWVYLPRRHDRQAEAGWGWSGSLYMRERFFATPHLCDRRTYWTEQIMSSTLFHLYRLLGGDAMTRDASGTAVPDVAARRAAADHASFLIVAAIVRQPAEAAVAFATPEAFAGSLIDADRATTSFVSGANSWRGGTAAKLVAYAFQRQGMGHPAERVPVDAPARPPVDVYAEDGGGGEYAPDTGLDDAWMRAAAIVMRRTPTEGPDEPVAAGEPAHVYVRFGNRGAAVASAGTVVRIHVAPWGAEGPPGWPDPQWTLAGAAAVQGAAGLAGPVAWQAPAGAGRHAVLVELADEGDASLIDRASDAPCATGNGGTTPVRALVVGDNNLALRRIDAQ